MSPHSVLLVIVGLVLISLVIGMLYRRSDLGRVIEAGLDEVREPVPPSRARAYHRVKGRMEEALAVAVARAGRVEQRLTYLGQVWVDEASTFVAEHRKALGKWLFVFDFVAQAMITVVQRPGLPFWSYPLLGCSLAALYAAFGWIAVLLIALAFRHRPPRGWAIVDAVALVTGFGAILAAVALLVARAVLDPRTISSIQPYADALLSPLIVWGGFAAGLAQGVAHLQTERDRLARDRRRLEGEIDARRNGLSRLEELARELGILVTLLLLVLSACTATSMSSVPNQAVSVDEATVGSSRQYTTFSSTESHTVPALRHCGIVLDGSASPDPDRLMNAIDSALVVMRYLFERYGCQRLLAAVATSDTIWMASRWFAVPPSAQSVCSVTGMRTGIWGSMLRGVSPRADSSERADSASRCSVSTGSARRAREERLDLVVSRVREFLRTTHPITSPDTTALIEILQFLDSGEFVSGIIVTDGIETKRADSIPRIELRHAIIMILSPTGDRFGGAPRSVVEVSALQSRMVGLEIVPYTSVETYLSRSLRF